MGGGEGLTLSPIAKSRKDQMPQKCLKNTSRFSGINFQLKLKIGSLKQL